MARPPVNPFKRTQFVVALCLFAAVCGVALSVGSPLELWHQRQMYLPPSLDSTPPSVARIGDERHILLFAKTNGYRHHAAIAAGQRALEQIAADHFWFVYVTENAAAFNSDTLQQFDSVVFNNTSGRLFTLAQQHALDAFVEAGGGVHYLRNQASGQKFRNRLAAQIDSRSVVRTPADPRSPPPAPASQNPAPQS